MQHIDRLALVDGHRIRFPSLAHLHALLALWRMRARTRRALAKLDGRALADIGISDAERRRECARAFWA